MTVALMWEARALPGRGPDLVAWVRAQPLTPEPLRRETLTAPEDRVLVITWWAGALSPGDSGDSDDSGDHPADLPELPEPGGDLVGRAVHRWRFETVD